MKKHDERIDNKIAGPAWDRIREKVMKIHWLLLDLHETATSELTTIYIKYKTLPEPMAPVFAVMWIRTTKKVILGLAAPEKIEHQNIIDAPFGMKYKGLTSFLEITEDHEIPVELEQWAEVAFYHVNNSK